MKNKLPIIYQTLLILISMTIGAGSTYYLTETIQRSHETTYTLEEEISVYDRIIDMANKDEIDQSDLVRIFESEKKRRVAAHKVISSTQRVSMSVITALAIAAIVQIAFVFLSVPKKNEE